MVDDKQVMAHLPLSELAALVAERVPGFVMPIRDCHNCGGEGTAFESKWCTRQSCRTCSASGKIPDYSHATLVMAAQMVIFSCDSSEKLARAHLYSLLQGYGTQRPDE